MEYDREKNERKKTDYKLSFNFGNRSNALQYCWNLRHKIGFAERTIAISCNCKTDTSKRVSRPINFILNEMFYETHARALAKPYLIVCF